MVKVRAYCSSANLGAGFDVAAVALDAFYDEVEVFIEQGNGNIYAEFHGPYSKNITEENTASLSAKLFLAINNANFDVRIKVWKGIPIGAGLGSSGATAAATVKALSLELGSKMEESKLAQIAGMAERVAAGSAHYDNATASLMGGLIIIYSLNPLKFLKFNPNLKFLLGIPKIKTPVKKTEIMRSITPRAIPLEKWPPSLARMAALVAGLYMNSLELIGYSMNDEIVEASRSPLIPAYDKLRKYCIEAGAYGFTISGAGPSVIALIDEERKDKVMNAMLRAYEEEGIEAEVILTKTAPPASAV